MAMGVDQPTGCRKTTGEFARRVRRAGVGAATRAQACLPACADDLVTPLATRDLISNDTQPSCPTLASRAMLYIRTAYLR